MLGGNQDRDAPITLCIFPNQREFIVIDSRSREVAAVHVMTVEQLADGEFATGVEQSFSDLIRTPGIGFNDLMAIPQQIELAMRVHALRRVLRLLGIDEHLDEEETAAVGVLFFSGSMLAVDDTKLRITLREMFGDKLSDDQMSELQRKLTELMDAERQAERALSKQSIEGLIRGDDDSFVTIWRQNTGE